jgi:hypothetical protein
MTMQTDLAAMGARLTAAINAADNRRATVAADLGNKAALTTTEKGSIVGALNEVKAAIDAVQPGQSAAQVTTAINNAIAALINGADVNNDTLLELANRITALAQADAGLVSAAAVQAFTAPQQAQACANIGIGDPAHNYVTAIEASLNAGL